MKKWLSVIALSAAVMLSAVCLPERSMLQVHAQSINAQNNTSENGKTVVALGADLTAEQRKTVLELMGITEEQLAGYEVIYVTNDQEHQYLDDYLSSSVIGSKSLSSVMLKKGEKGSGVTVTTRNVNYCTTGMYRNALLTAGVEDTEVIVAAPTQISGTAALIGAVKAYEKMEGTAISDVSLSNALDELITTGELAEAAKNVSSEEIEQLIAYIKEKVAKGQLETEDDIRAAIEEGEEQFGVVLTEEEVQRIIDLMNKLESMGLNSEYLLSQAEKLYNKYGADIVNRADEAITEAVNDAVKEAATEAADGFFESVKKTVKDFWNSLFGK